jgi:hypothetical protein
MTTDVDSPTAVVPFGWEGDVETASPEDRDLLFRFPSADDPAPDTRRILAMSLYASALGLVGIGVGLRVFVSVLGGVPGWYVPVLALLGLTSVALSVAAFLSIHRRVLPHLFLAAAALPLSGAVLLAVSQ